MVVLHQPAERSEHLLHEIPDAQRLARGAGERQRRVGSACGSRCRARDSSLRGRCGRDQPFHQRRRAFWSNRCKWRPVRC